MPTEGTHHRMPLWPRQMRGEREPTRWPVAPKAAASERAEPRERTTPTPWPASRLAKTSKPESPAQWPAPDRKTSQARSEHHAAPTAWAVGGDKHSGVPPIPWGAPPALGELLDLIGSRDDRSPGADDFGPHEDMKGIVTYNPFGED